MTAVHLLSNTVEISDAVAQRLIEKFGARIPTLSEKDCPTPADLLSHGKLLFDPDHEEYLDWLQEVEAVLPVLAEQNVCGDITFGSLEGSYAGKFWGYRFDGHGGFRHITSELVWK